MLLPHLIRIATIDTQFVLSNLYVYNNPLLARRNRQTNHETRITRRYEFITHSQITRTMYNISLALLFIAISAYYVYSMNTRHAVIILYLLVANVAEPFRTFARYIKLDCFTHTCWMSMMLCCLFDHYDVDPATLLVFTCWEFIDFHLLRFLGLEPENNDIVYIGLYPIFATLYRKARGLLRPLD